jgi:hypothetical protein
VATAAVLLSIVTGTHLVEMVMLQRGETVPHFDVQTVDAEMFSYSAIWQRRNLVLIALPPTGVADEYVRGLTAREAEFSDRESVCVVTRDAVPGVPIPGALVADRWGEIVEVIAASGIAALPTPVQLLDWVEYIQNRCPECEGEAK